MRASNPGLAPWAMFFRPFGPESPEEPIARTTITKYAMKTFRRTGLAQVPRQHSDMRQVASENDSFFHNSLLLLVRFFGMGRSRRGNGRGFGMAPVTLSC